MNDLDKLIRQLEGADYYREPQGETRIPLWRGMIPATLSVWALVIAAGYWLVG